MTFGARPGTGKSWYSQQYLQFWKPSFANATIRFLDQPREATPAERRTGWLKLQTAVIDRLSYDVEFEGGPRERPRRSFSQEWEDLIIYSMIADKAHTHEYTLLVNPPKSEHGFAMPQQRFVVSFFWPDKITPDCPLFSKDDITRHVEQVTERIVNRLKVVEEQTYQSLKGRRAIRSNKAVNYNKPWYTKHHKSVYNQRKLG